VKPGAQGIAALRKETGERLFLDVVEQRRDLLGRQSQIRHAHVAISREEVDRDGVLLIEQSIRLGDVLDEPGAIAARGHAREIGTDRRPAPDGVASGAAAPEQVSAAPDLRHRGRFGIALQRPSALRIAEKVGHGGGEEARIVDGGVAHPLSGRLVPDHQARLVAVAAGKIRQRRQAELLAHQLDVVFVAGEEQPARSGVELLRIRLQHCRGVVCRIDADGIEMDVLADPVAEKPLHLG